MLNYVIGDLFDSPAQVLVNTVNVVGAMGKGIAKDFKRIYPDMFKQYQALCEDGRLDTGTLWLYKTPHKWILNFPTKKHWRSPSKLDYVEQGLKKFVATYDKKEISSIAFPQLGCGNGGLDWPSQVRPLMEKYLGNLLIDVFIYVYKRDSNLPEHRDIKATAHWLRQEPAQLPFAEVMLDLQELLVTSNSFRVLGSNEPFNCYLHKTNDQHMLRFEVSGTAWDVEEWQLLLLWNQLRDLGFCAKHMMPCGLAEISPLLITLFSELPYLKLTRVSGTYEGLDNCSLGLQISPPVASKSPAPITVARNDRPIQQRFLV